MHDSWCYNFHGFLNHCTKQWSVSVVVALDTFTTPILWAPPDPIKNNVKVSKRPKVWVYFDSGVKWILITAAYPNLSFIQHLPDFISFLNFTFKNLSSLSKDAERFKGSFFFLCILLNNHIIRIILRIVSVNINFYCYWFCSKCLKCKQTICSLFFWLTEIIKIITKK